MEIQDKTPKDGVSDVFDIHTELKKYGFRRVRNNNVAYRVKYKKDPKVVVELWLLDNNIDLQIISGKSFLKIASRYDVKSAEQLEYLLLGNTRTNFVFMKKYT